MNNHIKFNLSKYGRILLCIAVLVSFGFIRIPLESSTEKELEKYGFRDWVPDISAREQLTQAGFLGAIGGFRSLVASIYDLRAHEAFRDKDWASVERFRKITTSLQPRFSKHWDLAAWDMAWNAYAYYRSRLEFSEDDLEKWQIEKMIMPNYVEKGLNFAKEGAKWTPESYLLPMVVGDIYSQKYNNPKLAADWYFKSSQAEDAPTYIFRAYATHLAKCKGMEEEAYGVVSNLYNDGKIRTLTIRRDMERLEDFMINKLVQTNSVDQLTAMIEKTPSNYLLNAALAEHYLKSDDGTELAIEAYRVLLKNPKAPQFYRRKFGFLVALNPETQLSAYQLLKKMYTSIPQIFREKDLIELSNIENSLNIPLNEKVIKGSGLIND